MRTMADPRALAEQGAAELGPEATAEQVLAWGAATFGRGMIVASNMQDAVLVDLAARAVPGVDVLFLETGYHFPETIGTRDAVAAVYDVTIVNALPEHTVAEQDALLGRDLFARDPDQCCFLRKVVPLDRALAGYDAWASGLRRDESFARSRTPVVDWDARNGKVKINPIARWTKAEVEAYIETHDILVNPLLDEGYPSIGCFPCTRRVGSGENDRDGRWAGTGKTECGIHLVTG